MSGLKGLDAQISAMEESLMANPALPPEVRAYLHLQAARRLLGGHQPAAADSPQDYRSHLIPSRGAGKVFRKVDPDRLRVLEHAANLIRGKTFPTKTAEIFEGLDPAIAGLIRGGDPKGNLSAMLFHSPAFASHGRQGWTLKDSGIDVEEQGAGGSPQDEEAEA